MKIDLSYILVFLGVFFITLTYSEVYGQLLGGPNNDTNPSVIETDEPIIRADQKEINLSDKSRVDKGEVHQENHSNLVGLYLMTPRSNYVVGQQVIIHVQITDDSSREYSQLEIIISKENSENPEFTTNLLLPNVKDTSYIIPGPSLLTKGTYKLEGNVFNPNTNTSQSSQIYFYVGELFNSTPFYFVYLGIGFFVALLVVIIRGTRNRDVNEILRFVFITGIVMSAISTLLFTDLSIGYYSPVGLIKNDSDEWFLNIGGKESTDTQEFQQAINIPIYVIVLGLIGGYIRYLYKTAKVKLDRSIPKTVLFRWSQIPGTDSKRLKNYLKKNLGMNWINSEDFIKSGQMVTLQNQDNTIKIVHKNNFITIEYNGIVLQTLDTKVKNGDVKAFKVSDEKLELFYYSVEDLALLFLAPLLAIAIWFFLVQGGIEGKYTLALAAFASGLATDEIIGALSEFMRRVTGKARSNMDDQDSTSTTEQDSTSTTEQDSGRQH